VSPNVTAARFGHELIERMGELGFFLHATRESAGGLGLDYVPPTIEELSRVDARR